MVKKKGDLYVYEECGFLYEDELWVEKYGAWRGEYKGCSVDIVKHSVKGGG